MHIAWLSSFLRNGPSSLESNIAIKLQLKAKSFNPGENEVLC